MHFTNLILLAGTLRKLSLVVNDRSNFILVLYALQSVILFDKFRVFLVSVVTDMQR